MTGSNARWIPLVALTFAATLAACGSSSTSSTSSSAGATATPTVAAPTPTAAPAAAQCPSGSTVGSALGTTLPDAVGVPAGSSTTPLPAGATGIVCEYHTTTANVIITAIQNIPASTISQFSSKFPVTFTPVSGVGDQARSFDVSLGGGKDNIGLVAAKGTTVVALVATATPATLSQIEALVNSLL